ncbi:MAG: serine/threonine-protein kinase [Phycisphaerales bacterium]|jgi:serine/threonine protein kinase|nr:serine/threonine-protein kinase [Phycisphaerales bacterium]
MTKSDYPTDPNAETVGLPSDDSGKGSVPEPGKFTTTGMPSEIGRYKVLGIIASGGMGVVYEAMQEAPRRRVALKVIKVGAASEMALHRFHFESQTLAKLSHPHIAQIYEAGTWESENGEVPFFAMEYIPGARGIVEYANNRNLPVRDRLELFRNICEAVQHAHQKGVIHRDLKPDNILVDSNGDAKIIDFGVARATDADLAVTTMQTTMGQLIGTLQYMSPEQCDADPDRIDTRSDVYALGVILFQLLSGKLPYDLRRQAIHEAVRIIKEQRPDSLGTISTTLRGDIDTIALKAMEKDRDRRYQSAAELANDIYHFLNNEPIIARPLSIGYQLKLFTKKYKRSCAAVFFLLLSIILGTVGTSLGWMEANYQKEIAEERYEKILDMSQEFIGEFYSGIVKLNAAMEVRKLVLDSTLKHLNELEETSGDTPEIRATKAMTNARIAAYYGSLRGANLGEFEKAKQHYEITFDIYNELIDAGYKKYRYNLSLTRLHLSDLLRKSELYDESLSQLDSAKSILLPFIADNPDDAKARRLLEAGIEVSKLDTLNKAGRVKELRAATDELLQLLKVRAFNSPTDLVLQRDYASLLQRAGKERFREKDYVVAASYYVQTIEMRKIAIERQPQNGRAKRDLAWSYYFLGETKIADGSVSSGLDYMEMGLSILNDRIASYPKDSDARSDLISFLNSYISNSNSTNNIARASEKCLGVLVSLQVVVEKNPYNYALADTLSRVQMAFDEMTK